MRTAAPNSWIRFSAESSTVLTYAVEVSPAPWEVAPLGALTGTAALQIVITNGGTEPVDVDSITFSFPVGTQDPPGPSLMPSTANVVASVSDSINWQLTGPGTITSGTAQYVLGPKTGSSVTLAAGDAVAIELSSILTNTAPGTAPVSVVELTGSGPKRGDTSFEITTFPAGFFFAGLTASVYVDSTLVPVAQVPAGTQVTLTWNASVLDTAGVAILYGTAGGQVSVQPTLVGEWTMPPPGVTADTVFTVVVGATFNGVSYSASESIAVGVSAPALVGATLDITDGTQTVSITPSLVSTPGLSAGGITASELGVTDGTSTTAIAPTTVSTGSVTAAAVTVTGGGNTTSLTPTQLTTANVGAGAITSQSLSTAGATVTDGTNTLTLAPTAITASGAIGLPAIGSAGPLSIMTVGGQYGGTPIYLTAPTDGFAIAYILPQGDVDDQSAAFVTIQVDYGGFTALGANMSPTDTKSNVPMPGYLCVPVRKGVQITWSWSYVPDNDTNPLVWAYFAGLGGGVAGPEQAPRPGPTAVPPLPPPPTSTRGTAEERATALVDVLTPLFREAPDAGARKALIDAIVAMTCR
jgi:hypothetical protein